MSVYYVDNINGNENNDGLTEATAVVLEACLNISAGDTVLFRRGNFYRRKLENISGEVGKMITYGAYGEGAMPVISGSLMDYADSALWTSTDGGTIWTLQLDPSIDAGNIVMYKDGVEAVARRVQELGHVVSPADYWYDFNVYGFSG